MYRFRSKLADATWKYEGQNLGGGTFDVVNQNTGEVMEFVNDVSAQAWAETNPTEDQISTPPPGSKWEAGVAKRKEEQPSIGDPYSPEPGLFEDDEEPMVKDDPESAQDIANRTDEELDAEAREFVAYTGATATGWDEMLAEHAMGAAGVSGLNSAELHRSRAASDLFDKLYSRVQKLVSAPV